MLLVRIFLHDAWLLGLMRHLGRHFAIVLIVGILVLKSHILLVNFASSRFKCRVAAMTSLLRMSWLITTGLLSFVVSGLESLQ